MIEITRYMESISEIADLFSSLEGTFFVTGATGLIGSCLIDVLLYLAAEHGNKIRIWAASRRIENLKTRFGSADPNIISFIEHNMANPLQLPDQIDFIIHAASIADPLSYSRFPVETMQANILGTYYFLEYCKNHLSTRFLFTSSFEVYGKIEGKDIYSESDFGIIELNSLRSCYPESKRCAEIMIRSYHQEYRIDCIIARLCSIYGPTMASNDSKAHAQFIRNGLAGEDVILKSKGRQIRSYCYVMDAVSGLFTVLQRGESGEIYNIANEKSVASIATVAQTVADICKSKVVFTEPRQDEKQGYSTPKNCILDNNKMKRLGWEGKYSLFEGFSETISIMREHQMEIQENNNCRNI